MFKRRILGRFTSLRWHAYPSLGDCHWPMVCPGAIGSDARWLRCSIPMKPREAFNRVTFWLSSNSKLQAQFFRWEFFCCAVLDRGQSRLRGWSKLWNGGPVLTGWCWVCGGDTASRGRLPTCLWPVAKARTFLIRRRWGPACLYWRVNGLLCGLGRSECESRNHLGEQYGEQRVHGAGG